jgi:hypothetical protein
MKFFAKFNIDELVEVYGHKVLWLSSYHAISIPLNWSGLRFGDITSNIGQNGFGMEAVKKTEELLKQVCIFVFVHSLQSNGLKCHI